MNGPRSISGRQYLALPLKDSELAGASANRQIRRQLQHVAVAAENGDGAVEVQDGAAVEDKSSSVGVLIEGVDIGEAGIAFHAPGVGRGGDSLAPRQDEPAIGLDQRAVDNGEAAEVVARLQGATAECADRIDCSGIVIEGDVEGDGLVHGPREDDAIQRWMPGRIDNTGDLTATWNAEGGQELSLPKDGSIEAHADDIKAKGGSTEDAATAGKQ